MYDITGEMLVDTVREIAQAAPDTVYDAPEHMQTSDPDEYSENPRCFYVHTDESGNPQAAGCLVGQALHALGFSLDALSQHEERTAENAAKGLGIPLTDRQADWLNAVQWTQDAGETWGTALMEAGK